MKFFTLTLSAFLFVSAVCAQQWTELNPTDNLFNNNILTTVVDKTGKIYAAGQFTDTSNSYTVKTLVNGTWVPVGAPSNMLEANGNIYALAVDSSGNVYAAGAFTNSSGNYYVAKWNGSIWSTAGNGNTDINTTGQVFALATDNAGNLYAGGELVDASGNYYIAKWDGQLWTQLGTGNNGLNANGLIYSILPDPSGNIYTGGHFTNPAGNYYIANWNGTSWGELGTGLLKANSYISTLARDAAGNIYTAGDFTDSTSKQYVAMWDGNSWAALGTGNSALAANGTINSIAFDASSRLNAAGRFSDNNGLYYVAQWSGTGWSEIPGNSGVWPANSYISSLGADHAGRLYVAGDFRDVNNDRYVAVLSGGTWSEPGLAGSKFPVQANPMHVVATDTAGHVFAVLGDMDGAGIPITEMWDGHTWNRVNNTVPGGFASLTGLAPDSSGNMYACGNFAGNNGIAKWNGSGWSVLPGQSAQLTFSSINHIGTDKKGNVYISGSFSQNGISGSMAKWDGNTWQVFANDPIFYFIVDSAGTIYAANEDFSNTGFNVLQIKGNTAVRIGGSGFNQLNANSWVQAMTMDKAGNLYAAGGFTDSTGNTYVAKWNGTNWAALGAGTTALNATGTGYGLDFDNAGNLYVSGSIMLHNATYLAKWDGHSWTAVSNGPEFWYQNSIDFMSRDGRGNIYAGGQFNGSQNSGNYIYSYTSAGPAVQPVIPCRDTAVTLTLGANETTVTNQSGTVLVTANTIGTGTNTHILFSKTRDFSSLLPASDSIVSLEPATLQTGTNTIYVKLTTTGACGTLLTATDSITIVKTPASGGLIDIDFPNTPIIPYPNPFSQFIDISGLQLGKSYSVSLFNGLGEKVRAVVVTGQGSVQVDAASLQPGIYMLVIYDNTKGRKIGTISLLKVQ